MAASSSQPSSVFPDASGVSGDIVADHVADANQAIRTVAIEQAEEDRLKAEQDRASKLPSRWEITREGTQANPRTLRNNSSVPTVYNPLTPGILWPGIGPHAVSLTYTNSHGIAPGTASLVYNPGGKPKINGDLVFNDRIHPAIRLRDCYVENITVTSQGNQYRITISDRRWRWQQSNPISGEYNRLDDNGNLVPWTMQSATELAILCLKKMGEKRYTIAFPPGLKHKQGEAYDQALRAGQRFPLTFANPYVCWDYIPAAVALMRLADEFGCRVMFDPISDAVGIMPVGYGQALPYSGTSVAAASEGITTSRVPKYVGVLGAPIKFQMRIPLEAVGEEYDGYLTQIDKLSYAPIITEATASAPSVTGWDHSPPQSFPNVEPTDRLEYTEAQQFAQRMVHKAYRIRSRVPLPFESNFTGFGGPKADPGVDIDGTTGIEIPGFTDKVVQGPESDHVAALKNSRTKRRQQIIMTPFKVDQIVPAPRRDQDLIVGRVNPNNDPGALPDYYNGHSRDRPAECFGTYYIGCTQQAIRATELNAERRRVYMPFSVNPIEQIVVFSSPVYQLFRDPNNDEPTYKAVDNLFIETGCVVLDPDTNAPLRSKFWLEIPGGTAPPVWEVHDDIILNIIGIYEHDLTKGSFPEKPDSLAFDQYRLADMGVTSDSRLLDPKKTNSDAEARSKYYLAGLRRRFRSYPTQTITYNGVMSIPVSGSVQQITWSVAAGDIKTTASMNNEFSDTIPRYPVRKMQEAMVPDVQARIMNAISSPQAAARMAENAWSK